jgi:hypothetical protein
MRLLMALRNGLIACLCMTVVAFGGFSAAVECRAVDFLGLDL